MVYRNEIETLMQRSKRTGGFLKPYASCLNRLLNVKVLVGTFNQNKALVLWKLRGPSCPAVVVVCSQQTIARCWHNHIILDQANKKQLVTCFVRQPSPAQPSHSRLGYLHIMRAKWSCCWSHRSPPHSRKNTQSIDLQRKPFTLCSGCFGGDAVCSKNI